MMIFNYFCRCRIILLIAFIFLLSGCQHTIEIQEKSDGSEGFIPIAQEPEEGVPLSYVKTVKVVSDGVEYPPSENLLYRVRSKLLETKLFYDVVFQRPPVNHVELNLMVEETRVNNEGENFTKGMAAALTLGLLAPVFPQDFEYHSEYNLSVTNFQRKTKQYNASSSGTLEASSGQRHLGELYQIVINNNLNSLMSQLLKDLDFILMEKANSSLSM